MFGYVSFSQLSTAIRTQLHAIPSDVDLIVGIPRSGMVPAYQIGLFLNRLVSDIDANARPLFRPTLKIGHIVSARLEKYRSLTPVSGS